MCRIVGFAFSDRLNSPPFSESESKNTLVKMRDSMTPGGPDYGGYYSDRRIFLGHRRLSIVDLNDTGNQPMVSNCGRWVIVFNGEIYNHNELRKDLLNHGVSFHGTSDTEVLLNCWIKWGDKCLTRLVGMYAFTIYDKNRGVVYLVRDRIGVKPLYYLIQDNFFAFSSECKSFHELPNFRKKISIIARNFYFKFGYIEPDSSIYEGVLQVKPGSFVEISINNIRVLRESLYWDIRNFFNKHKLKISYDDAIAETENLLDKATMHRWSADVPIGVFLSSGIDSSTILSILKKNCNKKISTFTLGLNDRGLDESIVARSIAKFYETNHVEIKMNLTDFKELLPSIFNIWDEPFSDTSQIPTLFLAKHVSKTFKTIISADGGDELFYGYSRYPLAINRFKKIRILKKIFSPTIIDAITKFTNNNFIIATKLNRRLEIIQELFRGEVTLKNTYLGSQHIFLDKENRLLFDDGMFVNLEKDNFICNDRLDNLIYSDFLSYLPGNLMTKLDRATMSTGLEAREPLLDHQLIEYVVQLPTEYKIRGFDKKIILKDALAKRGHPPNFISRNKMGFGAPIEAWIKEDPETRNDVIRALSVFANDGPKSRKKYVDELIKNFDTDVYKFKQVWVIYCWQKWVDRWMH